MSARSSEEHVPGPAPLPTFHGKGCICNMHSRHECPAAATPEGQRRERLRLLNRARARVIQADAAIQAALGEKAAAVAALNNLELPG